MLIEDFHQMPVHAYRARIIEQYDDYGHYAPAYYRLCMCKCGSGVYYDEQDIPHELKPGDIFWYTPNVTRKSRSTSEHKWIISYLNFGGSAIKSGLLYTLGLDMKSCRIRLDDEASARIEMLLYRAAVHYSEDTEAGNVIMHSILYDILCELSIAMRGREVPEGVSYDFSGALAYIRHNLKNDLSIGTLCDATGMSRSRLYAVFDRELGKTPNEYVISCRLDRAAELLSERNDMTVREISIESGFSGTGYFTKQFKARYGITPGEYRASGRAAGGLSGAARDKLPLFLTNAGDMCDAPVNYTDIPDQNCWQLMYCTSGSGVFTDDNGNSHTITPGMICFLSPDSEAHYQPLDTHWGVIWLRFSGKKISGFTRYLGFGKSNVIENSRDFRLEYLYKPLIYNEPSTYDFEGVFTWLYKNAWNSDFNSVLRCSVRLYELLIYTAILSEDEENLSTPEEQRLLPAVELIRQRYTEKLTNKQLADSAGISEMHLFRLFKTVFRKTPGEYLTEYRMERAKSKLLRHPNRSVRQIAKEVGYADAAAFAEVFKKYSGYTPNDYRNINL